MDSGPEPPDPAARGSRASSDSDAPRPTHSSASGVAGLSLAERAIAIHDRLVAHYGPGTPKPIQEPLAELVATVLSQNTADVNSERAYASLVAHFGDDWEAVRTAPAEEIADAIRIGGLAEVKSRRIKTLLDSIAERVGELDLSFLRDMSLEDARAFLLDLDGVGPKTAACVLLFSLGKPALPVDTHVHRVATRLGLVPKTSAERAHTLLEELILPERVYSFHVMLITHGRQICKAQRPLCSICPVNDLCPYPATIAAASSEQEC